MARFVGDTWTVTASIVDGNGNPADATSVAMTVLQPDSTTVGPTGMTHAGTGVYTATFTAAQAGMHTATFVATGAVSPTGTVDFYAYPSGQQAQGIVSLAEVQSYLRLTTAQVASYQPMFSSWLQASRALIEDIVGDLVVSTLHDEWYDGGQPIIMLLHAPLSAPPTAVTETFGANVVRTLTNEPIDGSTPVDAYGYTVDLETGKLTRRVTGIAAPFAMGRMNVHVQYTTGRPGPWRENIRLANLETIRWWWVAFQQASVAQPMAAGAGLFEDTPAAAAIELPVHVLRLLGRRTETVGLA
jgi:Invasin, domain 3